MKLRRELSNSDEADGPSGVFPLKVIIMSATLQVGDFMGSHLFFPVSLLFSFE